MVTTNGDFQPQADIIDIRREELDESLLKLMLTCLDPDNNGPRTLPTLLLYDGRSRCVARLNFNSCGSRGWIEAF